MKSQSASLEIDDDAALHQIEWRIQHAGWLIWGVIIAAGLLGLLGSGPISSATATAADDSLSIDYDRFVHYHHPLLVTARIDTSQFTEGELNLKISRRFLDRLRLIRVEPEPQRQQIAPDGVIFTFATADLPKVAMVQFRLEYEKAGTSRGRIELLGRDPVVFSQFVYP
ncbi:MAG: hypothetical protein WD851_14765 [Pirellulales bacterium]